MAADGTDPFDDIPVTSAPTTGNDPFADIPVTGKPRAVVLDDATLAAIANAKARAAAESAPVTNAEPTGLGDVVSNGLHAVATNTLAQDLVDNPLTRAAASAGTRAAAGTNELLARLLLKPIQDAVNALGGNTHFADTFANQSAANTTANLKQLKPFQGNGIGSQLGSAALELPFDISIGMASGGGGKAKAANEALVALESPTVRDLATNALKGESLRTASTLGAQGAAARAAQARAQGKPESTGQLASAIAAHTAANLLPMGEGLPRLARPVAGAAAGVGGQALIDLANGKISPAKDYALSSLIAAGLGGIHAVGGSIGGARSKSQKLPISPEEAIDTLHKLGYSDADIAGMQDALARGEMPALSGPAPDAPLPVNATRALPAPEAQPKRLPQLPPPPRRLPPPTIAVDSAGNAVTNAQALETARVADAAAKERRNLGLTPDVQRAQQARQEGVKTAEAEALQHGEPGEFGAPEPEHGAAPIDPEVEQHYFDDIDKEIGWDQEGGHIIRGTADQTPMGESDVPFGENRSGSVTGRTAWIGMPRVDSEGESDFWRNRPANARLTPDKARAALAKARAGEPLKPIEQRFVDYAHQQAREYAQEHADEMVRYEQALQEQNDIERQQDIERLRNEAAQFTDADASDALTLHGWTMRALDAGVPDGDLAPLIGSGTMGERVQRLAQAIKQRGGEHGTDTGANGFDRAGNDSYAREGQDNELQPPRDGVAKASEGQDEGAQAQADVTPAIHARGSYLGNVRDFSHASDVLDGKPPGSWVANEDSGQVLFSINGHQYAGGDAHQSFAEAFASARRRARDYGIDLLPREGETSRLHGAEMRPRSDLFAPATGSERLRAAREAKDAERNGLTRSQQPFTNTDLGATPRGEAPEQMRIPDRVPGRGASMAEVDAYRQRHSRQEVVSLRKHRYRITVEPVMYGMHPGDEYAYHVERWENGAGGGDYFRIDEHKTPTSIARRGSEMVREAEDRTATPQAQAPKQTRAHETPQTDAQWLAAAKRDGVRTESELAAYLAEHRHPEHEAAFQRGATSIEFDAADRNAAHRIWDDAREEPVTPDDLTPNERAKFEAWKRGEDAPKPVNEISESDLSPEDQELVRRTRANAAAAKDNADMAVHLQRESAARGEREADELGLRAPVEAILGGRSDGRVHFVYDEDGLPAEVRKRGKPIKRGNVRYGLHTPEGDTYIFTKYANTPAKAVWTAVHEIGHDAWDRFIEANTDVRVGNRTAREQSDKTAEMALQNSTLAKVADKIGEDRRPDDWDDYTPAQRARYRLQMVNEAVQELQAALRTGDWGEIEAKYGVKVPIGMRGGVKAAIANFVKRMKAILNAIVFKRTGQRDVFSDADVHDLLQSMWEAAKRKPGEMPGAEDKQRLPRNDDDDLASEEPASTAGARGDIEAARKAWEEQGTRSPYFRRWFGDSKVVDDEGEPLVVYHGTGEQFNAFDRAKAIGGQHWFTTDRGAVERGEVGAQGRGRIIDAYLSIKNPAGWREYDKFTLDELVARGYDGLALPDGDQTTYVAFEPTQIKSATGNRGTFDADNPRIDYSEEPRERADDTGRGAGGGAPDEVTGVKNAQTAKERAARGLDELDAEGRRSFGAVWDAAARKLADDPHAGQALAEHVANNPRALTAEETALLAQDRARIAVRRRNAAQEVNAAREVGDRAAETAGQAKLDLANRQMDTNDNAARQSGYEQGLGLAIRKAMAALDYSLEGMESRLQAAKGEPLTAADHAKLKDLADKIAAKDAEIEQLAAKRKGGRRSNRGKRTRAQLEDDLRQLKMPWREAQSRRDTIRQRQLAKQIMELKRRIDEGDFAKPEPKQPIDYSAQTRKMEADRNFLRRKFDRMALEAEKKNMSNGARAWELFLAIRRAVILSGVHTLGKLTTAALYRIALEPVEHVIQHGLGQIPGIKKIAKLAPLEGYVSPKAELHAFKETFSKETLREMGLKFGDRGTNDLLYGKARRSLYPWLDVVGQVHGALKAPEERFYFARAKVMLTDFEIRQLRDHGKTDAEISDHMARPDVQARIDIGAFHESKRSIFIDDNVMVNAIRGFQSVLRNSGKKMPGGNAFGRGMAALIDYMFPIMRVPSNYIGEAFSYLGGGAKAAAQLLASDVIRKGVSALTPEQADYIMRNLGKQTLGMALFALGYYGYEAMPQSFGTFYQQGDNNRKNVPHEGTIFGVPAWLAEAPAFLMLTFGANFHRIQDGIKTKTGRNMVGTGDTPNAIQNSLVGLLKETPYMYTLENVQDKLRNVGSLSRWAGYEAAGATIQPDVRRYARMRDKNARGDQVRRYPRGFMDAYKMNVPGLREQVPTRPERRR